jgi:hypothetical protein
VLASVASFAKTSISPSKDPTNLPECIFADRRRDFVHAMFDRSTGPSWTLEGSHNMS